MAGSWRLPPGSRLPAVSFDDGEGIASGYGIAGGDPDLSDAAVFGGFQFVLHLHSLNDQNALVEGDMIAFLDKRAHDTARHGGSHRNRSIGSGVAAAGTQGAGVFGAVGDAVTAHVNRGVAGAVVKNNAVGASRNQQGHDPWTNQMGVGFDIFAIDANAPLAGEFGRIYFDLTCLPVDFEVELHRREGFQAIPPMASRRAASFHALTEGGTPAAEPFEVLVASKTAAAAMAGMGGASG